jgi:dienelactone hydrolase
LTFSLLLSIGGTKCVVAQKPLIGVGSATKWSELGVFKVSNNGRLVSFTTLDSGVNTLHLQSTVSQWKMNIRDASLSTIAENSEEVVFNVADSLGIVNLNFPNNIHYINGVEKFQMICGSNSVDLLYMVKNRHNCVCIRDLKSGAEKEYQGVEKYWTGATGHIVILEISCDENCKEIRELKWLDISTGQARTMWRGKRVINLQFGGNSSSCVFATAKDDGEDSGENAIWYYDGREQMANKIADGNSEGVDGLTIGEIVTFDQVCGQIFFNLIKPLAKRRASNSYANVDVWSYKDPKLQSNQLFDVEPGRQIVRYRAVVELNEKKVLRLEYENEKIITQLKSDKKMKFVLVIRNGGGDFQNEWNWNKSALVAVFLVSLNSDTRKLIDSNLPISIASKYVLSYNESYIYYYNWILRNYFCYRISDGRRLNLTDGISARWTEDDTNDEPDSSILPCNIAGFEKGSDAIFVYDRNDIFRLDPSNSLHATNLSESKEHSSNFVFRFMPFYTPAIIECNVKVLVHVFNKRSKDEGIVLVCADSIKYLKEYNLRPYGLGWSVPIKARDTCEYFIARMRAEEFPNVFCTADFKIFRNVTCEFPERLRNWMTAELVSWKVSGDKSSQGILYKPENFDPRKKYPMIVYYYERLSDNLHRYMAPEESDGRLNIPLYVSHGYLVFTPDIHYVIGHPGASAYRHVISGVAYLINRGYVDEKRLGLQGHSFGGFETNYIITHSNLFAAAVSASGMSDFVSAYGSVIGDGTSRQRQYEIYRDRIGTTLWKRPDLYFENSPIFRADKVSTPLLLMANKADGDVPCQQGMEFFTALRRLRKKVWLLQYDGEGHNVEGEAAEDFTKRMFQFFNYYLKNEAPAKWMTVGVPANMKGVDSGLELDTIGNRP